MKSNEWMEKGLWIKHFCDKISISHPFTSINYMRMNEATGNWYSSSWTLECVWQWRQNLYCDTNKMSGKVEPNRKRIPHLIYHNENIDFFSRLYWVCILHLYVAFHRIWRIYWYDLWSFSPLRFLSLDIRLYSKPIYHKFESFTTKTHKFHLGSAIFSGLDQIATECICRINEKLFFFFEIYTPV